MVTLTIQVEVEVPDNFDEMQAGLGEAARPLDYVARVAVTGYVQNAFLFHRHLTAARSKAEARR